MQCHSPQHPKKVLLTQLSLPVRSRAFRILNPNGDPDHLKNLTTGSSTRDTPRVKFSFSNYFVRIVVSQICCMNFYNPHAKLSYLGELWVKTGNNTIIIYDKFTLLSLSSMYYNQKRWLYG